MDGSIKNFLQLPAWFSVGDTLGGNESVPELLGLMIRGISEG